MFWVGILTGKVKMPTPTPKPMSMSMTKTMTNGNGMMKDSMANGMNGEMEMDSQQEAREDYHLLQKKGARIRYGVDHGA